MCYYYSKCILKVDIMKRLKIIACKVFYRELSYLTANSENYVDVTYIKQGLHDTPSILNETLKEEIRKIDAGEDIHSTKPEFGSDFDAIVIVYGLCSNGIVGLSSDKYPIVVPKIDDCIAMFLGSYEKYKYEHKKNEGTYWYTPSWIENTCMPCEENHKIRYAEYKEKYGEENAEFILENLLSIKNYSRAGYIEWNELPFEKYEKFTKDAAKFYGWEYEKVKGDKTFLKDMIDGKWDDRFLVVEPKSKIVADYCGCVIKSEKV